MASTSETSKTLPRGTRGTRFQTWCDIDALGEDDEGAIPGRAGPVPLDTAHEQHELKRFWNPPA